MRLDGCRESATKQPAISGIDLAKRSIGLIARRESAKETMRADLRQQHVDYGTDPFRLLTVYDPSRLTHLRLQSPKMDKPRQTI